MEEQQEEKKEDATIESAPITDNKFSQQNSYKRKGFKRYIYETSKGAIALLIVSVIIIGGYAVFKWYSKKSEEALGTVKSWNEVKLPQLGNTEYNLSTKWKNGYVHYRFLITGYPDVISRVYDNHIARRDAKFTIDLLDKDRFTIMTKTIALNEMNQGVDNSNIVGGLYFEAKEPIAPDSYRDISGWTIGWYGFDAPAAPAPPTPKKKTKNKERGL